MLRLIKGAVIPDVEAKLALVADSHFRRPL